MDSEVFALTLGHSSDTIADGGYIVLHTERTRHPTAAIVRRAAAEGRGSAGRAAAGGADLAGVGAAARPW
eukprot:8844039-Pyramimonas_sp.AAC.1